MSNVVSKAEFARQQGVNKSTVTRWDKAGRLVLNERGKVLVSESIKLLAETDGHRTDLKEKHADSRGKNIGKPSSEQTDHDYSDMEAKEEDIGKDRAHWKAMTLDSENQMMLLNQAISEGDRVKLEDVIGDISGLAKSIKQGIQNLVDNLTPQIANISDEAEKKQRIESEVQKLIQQLS
ncbi:hypothetical protein P8629_02740 [Hydrogenovibrio sp. 3SP14C1]|uniref:hypothetical protein n=1 Tax=Hydrogenovibrio sp. 3SP14C1 TaxID=3038774 RepID=UPI0024164365|nr:hypothetical protein [Hydrogenovibrio sp. 3SP14C1]MDG4811914.1 hypothetical protein [Hydrogenovibrio sp. 3SP14C1]